MDSINSIETWLKLILTFYCISRLIKFFCGSITAESINPTVSSRPVLRSKSENGISSVSGESGRISLLLSLLSFPAVSLIVRWLLLRYNYDIIIICNQKTKFISFDVTPIIPIKPKSNQKIFTKKCGMVLLFSTMAILYVPMSQIFTYVGFNVAERCIYPIMVPFCLTIGLGLERLQRRKFVQSAFAIVITLLAVKTHIRVSQWQNDHVLSLSGAENGSIKSKVNLAVNLAANHDFTAAKIILGNALTHTNHADIFYNL